MPYQGRQPGIGVRNRFVYTATGGQTTFSGADSNGKTLAYQDGAYVDVYLNGVMLVPTTDFTATTKTSITLTSGATASDVVEILAYDISSIADTVSKSQGGTFDNDITINGDLAVDTDTLFVDAANNKVGIGTSSPSQNLHVEASKPSSDLVYFNNTNGTASDVLRLNTAGVGSGTIIFDAQSGDTTRFMVRGDGNVGIGTTSPAYNLDVTSTGDTTIQVKANSSGAGADDDASLVLDAAETGEAGVIFRNGGVSKARIEWFNTGPDLNIQTESGTNGNIDFQPNENLAMRITSAGRVGIGTGSPAYALDVHEAGGGASISGRIYNSGATASDDAILRIQIGGTTADSNIYFGDVNDSDAGAIRYDHSNNRMTFRTAAADEVYIHSNGALTVDNTDSTFRIAAGSTPGYTGGSGQEGWGYDGTRIEHQTDTTSQMLLNDSSSAAGTHNYIVFYNNGGSIGDIDTTDNTTIRYNTFTGAHWSQMHGSSDLLRGTVMSTIDELVEWTSFDFINAEGQTEKTTMAGTDYVVGQTYTIAIDEDGATAEATATGYDTAARLMKVKVSDVEGDPAVYGVFSGAYADGDISVEALGAGVIRIGAGVTVQRGDLLMSAGDGTAKPQDDDVVRSKTIAKVTGNVVLETFDDGSYLVACVLMAG